MPVAEPLTQSARDRVLYEAKQQVELILSLSENIDRECPLIYDGEHVVTQL